jgi:A/G-specific adenine glycosylase
MSEISPAKFRRALLGWYRRNQRDLPWRRTRDPWAIHVSEIMLQQTRVAAVLPYYERFLVRYPTPDAFAQASESELLACWAGLGYYSRARNLQKAAERIALTGEYPRDYRDIRALPGVGDYTAAAIGSIAFGHARAAVDGNVLRVFARITAEKADPRAGATRERLTETAQALVHPNRPGPNRPGDFNQALMELGATVCLPRNPRCAACPVSRWCEAHALGLPHQLPVKSPKPPSVDVVRRLLIIQRNGAVLLCRVAADSRRLAGFWDLPEAEQIPGARIQKTVAEFRHTIVNTNHRCHVSLASAGRRATPPELRWTPLARIASLPLSTMARKALALAGLAKCDANPAHSPRV